MKTISVGDSCIDLYENLNIWYPTGNCVDFAINLQKLGAETSIITAIGNDFYGTAIENALQEYHVDISHLHTAAGKTAITKMDMNGNDRIHLECDEGVMKDFTLTDADIEYIKEYDILHTVLWGKIDDYLYELKQNGISIVYDFCLEKDEKKLKNMLPNVNYAFFSYDQDDQYIRDFLKWTQSLGLNVVIATLGENGSIAYNGEKFIEQRIIPVEVVNTVGAGDSFLAGYVFGLTQRQSVKECMELGAKIAAEIVQKFKPY